jgi:hypothetical protein
MRRRLMIRRYGPLAFGLGYLDHGSWVDHTTVDSTAIEEDPATAAVHALLGCCTDGHVTLLPAAAPGIRVVEGAAASGASAASRLAP